MRVLNTTQAEEWMGVLGRTAQHDFYHLPCYHRLAESRGEGNAHLFVHDDGSHLIALPLLLRPLPDGSGADWSDATSVYGYAGPVASHADMPGQVVRNFQQALTGALAERHVVTAFSRLHPLIAQHAVLAGLGECHPGGQTVSIDLTLPADVARARFRASHRTRINKLRRDGVTGMIDGEKRHLREFISIYHETMRRVGAQDSYFFDEEYFTGLVECLGSALQLFVTTDSAGNVLCGALFTICDGVVQYHLGGTRDSALTISPMALLFDTARLWASEQRARILHLGGGVGGGEDSLFRFKSGFSDSRHDFATWRWIIAPEVYRKLCDERLRADQLHGLEPVSADFFPAYRCPAVPCAAASIEVANA